MQWPCTSVTKEAAKYLLHRRMYQKKYKWGVHRSCIIYILHTFYAHLTCIFNLSLALPFSLPPSRSLISPVPPYSLSLSLWIQTRALMHKKRLLHLKFEKVCYVVCFCISLVSCMYICMQLFAWIIVAFLYFCAAGVCELLVGPEPTNSSGVLRHLLH